MANTYLKEMARERKREGIFSKIPIFPFSHLPI